MSISLALLVSADSETIQHFTHALQELSISPDICREVPAAIRLLNQRKFDAVIVDFQLGEQSGMVFDEVHLSASNRTAVTFAITGSDSTATAALRKTASFVLQRPLSPQSIRNTLRPAYGLILRERRRYFRCPMSTPVAVHRESMTEVRCYCVNLSEGGMALSTTVPLKPGEQVKIQFSLPGHELPCSAEATVCWWKTGRVGVRFDSLSQESKSDIQVWLARKLEDILPGFVAETFQNAGGQSTPTELSS